MKKYFTLIALLILPVIQIHSSGADPSQNSITAAEIDSKSDKEKIGYYIGMGDFYLKKNDYISAIESYNKALEIDDSDPVILLKSGEAYRLADITDEAINFYVRALKNKCSDIRVFLGMGVVLKEKLLYEESEKYFKKALEKEKNNITALDGLAYIYAEKGSYDLAIEMNKKLLLAKSNDETKNNIAELYIFSNNFEEAGKYFTASPESAVMSGYIALRSSSTQVTGSFGSDNETFIKGLSFLMKANTENAKKYFKILVDGKDDSLAKKLAIVLYGK
jgi:Tfp pilus assembly protein PilF